MNYMYTITTKNNIGKVRELILRCLGITFCNKYRKKEGLK